MRHVPLPTPPLLPSASSGWSVTTASAVRTRAAATGTSTSVKETHGVVIPTGFLRRSVEAHQRRSVLRWPSLSICNDLSSNREWIYTSCYACLLADVRTQPLLLLRPVLSQFFVVLFYGTIFRQEPNYYLQKAIVTERKISLSYYGNWREADQFFRFRERIIMFS
jgi:hypothetical protein